MELLFVGFPSLELVKKNNKVDRIIECKDINKIDNYIDNQKRILFINASSDGNVDRTKVNNLIRNVKTQTMHFQFERLILNKVL